MHMRIRYRFLADLHATRRAWNRKWEAYPEYSEQTNLIELNYSSYKPEIVIIDPKPYQSNHFHRESQTSINTSEFEHQ